MRGDARCKLQSLSDFNAGGDALLTFVRADNEKYCVTVTEPDLLFWRERIDAVLLKAKDKK